MSAESSSESARSSTTSEDDTAAMVAPHQEGDHLATPDHASEQPRKHRVLVIDDDMDTADLLVMLLESAGHQVEVATNGQYGLLVADSFEPELILLDIVMPGMNGFEVTQILRNAPKYASRFRHTRIIYLTGHRQILQQRFRSLPDTPVTDWIFKPFNPTELMDKVQRLFREEQAPVPS